MIVAAARHNLARLWDFDGRTPRELYLPFAHTVTGSVVLGLVLLGMQMGSTFSAGPGGVQGGGGGEVRVVTILLLVLVLGATGLLAAATVRRLHDVGRSGLWYAAIPLSVALTFLSIFIVSQDFGSWRLAIVLRLIAAVLFLAAPAQMIFLRLRGDPGPNRFGPPFTPDEVPGGGDGPGYKVESADARIAALLAERAQRKPQLSRPVVAPGFGRRRPPSSDT